MADAKFRELHPGIYLLHLPLPMRPTIVNVYLLHSGDEWALIDTGVNSSDSIAAFESILREVGCEPQHIRKIICTHHHPDHFGTSRHYKEMTGATLYLHPLEYERSLTFAPRDRSEEAMAFFRTHGIPVGRFAHIPSPHEFWAGLYQTTKPDAHINDGDVLRVGDFEIEVIWTPGHSAGHCVLYPRKERLMIVGDHLLPKITPHVGWVPGDPSDPLGDFLDSQRKVQRFDVDEVLPAHGAVYSDHRHRANQIIQHHHYRMQAMWDVIKAHPANAYDVAREVFNFDSDSPLTYQFPATFETLAHLRHMEVTGRAATEERDERVVWVGR